MVGQWSAVAGQVRRGGVELVGEQLERVGDSGAVGPVQGDGDAGGPVVNPATEVEQVAQDGPVLVGVGEVGVEMLGQPRLAVLGQQPQHCRRSSNSLVGGAQNS